MFTYSSFSEKARITSPLSTVQPPMFIGPFLDERPPVHQSFYLRDFSHQLCESLCLSPPPWHQNKPMPVQLHSEHGLCHPCPRHSWLFLQGPRGGSTKKKSHARGRRNREIIQIMFSMFRWGLWKSRTTCTKCLCSGRGSMIA
jgi:hypothetical protein